MTKVSSDWDIQSCGPVRNMGDLPIWEGSLVTASCSIRYHRRWWAAVGTAALRSTLLGLCQDTQRPPCRATSLDGTWSWADHWHAKVWIMIYPDISRYIIDTFGSIPWIPWFKIFARGVQLLPSSASGAVPAVPDLPDRRLAEVVLAFDVRLTLLLEATWWERGWILRLKAQASLD